MAGQATPVTIWHFTLKAEGTATITIVNALKQLAKKWCFQLEKGECKVDGCNGTDKKDGDGKYGDDGEKKACGHGYLHYQGKVVLWTRQRLATVVTNAMAAGLPNTVHWSVASTKDGKSFNYVMKVEARVEGPWKDSDDEVVEAPRDIKAITLRPFQAELVEYARSVPDTRIMVICDITGQCGKTTLARYMKFNKIAEAIPPFKDPQDTLQAMMCMATSNCYMVDIPRQVKEEKLREYWGSIEIAKNGMLHDKRHTFKQKMIPIPNIIVFTNTVPELNWVSEGRMIRKIITPRYTLIDYSEKAANVSKTVWDVRKEAEKKRRAEDDDETKERAVKRRVWEDEKLIEDEIAEQKRIDMVRAEKKRTPSIRIEVEGKGELKRDDTQVLPDSDPVAVEPARGAGDGMTERQRNIAKAVKVAKEEAEKQRKRMEAYLARGAEEKDLGEEDDYLREMAAVAEEEKQREAEAEWFRHLEEADEEEQMNGI